jgi:pimeloyl-ACP methyl ester carboxylesterase
MTGASATFSQRYWVNSAYASSPATNAPVIFHICGEGDATDGYFLNDSAIEWAKVLGAHIVYLEHRYYGQSIPMPDFSAPNMRYLSLDNVIEDLAGFQKWISAQKGWKGNWITVGGSYSGTLSALYRLKHPELVVGALASSAPMISGQGLSDMNESLWGDLNDTSPANTSGMRPWVYQACTTFGFWITDGSSIFEPSSSLCQSLFGDAPRVDASIYNRENYAPFVTKGGVKNVLFTYGSEDIWTQIGIHHTDNSGIEVVTIEGAGHHFDLNPPSSEDNAAVLAARAKFVKSAKSWLSMESGTKEIPLFQQVH